MNDPTRAALAAVALGLGVLWSGPPVLAQAFDLPVDLTQPADRPPGGDDFSASSTGTPSGETPSPDTAGVADGVDATHAEPSTDQAQSADGPLTADDFGALHDPFAGLSPSTEAVDTSEPPPLDRPTDIAAQMARWVTRTGDNDGKPFVIVDKTAADVFAFDADGQMAGGTPALLGIAPGDDSADGVGDRALYSIPPNERTTPAGRFVARFGAAVGHRKVLWVDYATAISLHPVVTSNPQERRLERLRSPDPEERRITFGCINVPPSFYKDVVMKAFADGSAVVYILPEARPLGDFFPSFALVARVNPPPARIDNSDDQGSQQAAVSADDARGNVSETRAPDEQGLEHAAETDRGAAAADDPTQAPSEPHAPENPFSHDLLNTAGADTEAHSW